MTTPLDHFEASLLTALREHVADRSPAASGVERDHPRALSARRRPRRLLVSGLATLGAAVAGVILVPGLGTSPAYSVQEGNAGEIDVQVNRFEDAAGLENALAEHGIDADITYVPNGGECAPGRYVPIDRRGIALSVGINVFEVTLQPGTIRDDEVLVIDASLVQLPDSSDPDTGITSTGGFRAIVDAEVTRGPVPRCTPVPPPS